MEVFVASAVVFLLAVLGMGVGTLFGRPFHGTCRGACGHCGPAPAHRSTSGRPPEHACEHRPAPQPVKVTWGDPAE